MTDLLKGEGGRDHPSLDRVIGTFSSRDCLPGVSQRGGKEERRGNDPSLLSTQEHSCLPLRGHFQSSKERKSHRLLC